MQKEKIEKNHNNQKRSKMYYLSIAFTQKNFNLRKNLELVSEF